MDRQGDRRLQGIDPAGPRAAAKAAKDLGGELTDVLWTLGEYDLVTVADFPDDETYTAFLLKVGSLGNIRTTTMRAFDRDEFAAIVARTG